MDGLLATVLDSGIEWPAVASGALVVVLGGTALFWVKRHWSHADDRDKQEQTAIKTELAGLGLKLESEREEFRSAIREESNIRREKDDTLGSDISRIREAFAYYCGASGKEKPRFDGRSE